MSKTVVVVGMGGDDKEAQAFRAMQESDAVLRERIELRFANREEMPTVIADAEVVACGSLAPEALAAAKNLKWLAYWSAGLDGKISPEIAARNLLITNASGVHGPNIAEHVLAWMLMFTREMPFHLRQQIAGKWEREGNQQRIWASELSGQTLGIVGLGRIGEALTKRAKSFAMHVVATKRDIHARYAPDIAPDRLYAPEQLPAMLAECDHICICLPLTPETHHLFDAELLSHIKPSAYLYNIGRGKIVDESALIAALQNGSLAGAGLDVFETEPLPAESPLWQMENVLITPHTAGITPYYFQRFADIFAANLKRYLNHEPLQNLYDPQRGY